MTPTGSLFLDPNVLEMGLFRKTTVGMIHHRKVSGAQYFTCYADASSVRHGPVTFSCVRPKLKSGVWPSRLRDGRCFFLKSSYLLAMRSWCENHRGGSYKPSFWPWPIPDGDSFKSRTSGFSSPPRSSLPYSLSSSLSLSLFAPSKRLSPSRKVVTDDVIRRCGTDQPIRSQTRPGASCCMASVFEAH